MLMEQLTKHPEAVPGIHMSLDSTQWPHSYSMAAWLCMPHSSTPQPQHSQDRSQNSWLARSRCRNYGAAKTNWDTYYHLYMLPSIRTSLVNVKHVPHNWQEFKGIAPTGDFLVWLGSIRWCVYMTMPPSTWSTWPVM
jgi:hypothetical protein